MQPDFTGAAIDDDRPSFPDPADDVLASAQSRRARLLAERFHSFKCGGAEPAEPWPVSIHY